MKEITTTQALEVFIQGLTGLNYSPLTIRAYRDDLNQFFSYVSRNRVDWQNVSRFDRVDIQGFLTFLAAQKTTGVTRRRKLAALKHFFKFLKENNWIGVNIAETVRPPKREEKEPAVLQKNEYKALLFEAQGEKGNTRDYAIIMLFLQGGLRVSELVKLTLNDVDLENREVSIRGGKGQKDRTIPIEQQTTDALKMYLAQREGIEPAFFLARNGTSLDVRSVRYLVAKYMKKAGIRKQASVHTLRHTYGTHKVNNGMPVENLRKLMGHKRKETTYHYVHLAQANTRQLQEQTAL
jgi:integrase/recombinase XerC